MLQARTGTQEEPIEPQHDGFGRDDYSEKNFCEFLVYDGQLIKKDCSLVTQALLLLPSSRFHKSTSLMLVEIKSKLTQNIRT